MLGAALLAPAALGAWTSEPVTTRGGEVRNELRLSVSTNTSTDPAVRLRAGEPATRTYHLSNHAEYPLGNVLLSDPQLPGGQFSCGSDRSIPPGGTIDCTTTFTAAPGPQSARVSAVADAPNHLPQSRADAPTGYLGITAGIRLTRLGTPSGTGLSHRSTPRTAPNTAPAAVQPVQPDRPVQPERLVRSDRSVVRAVAAGGGTVELQYRLEAFGDVPVTAASITEGLPGLGAVNCTGPDGGRTIAPGQAVDCRATGTARPGRQTGTARAEGTADDATVAPDGSRQAPRRVSAEASGTYDGLQPAPPGPEQTEPTAAGSGSGAGPAPGTGTGTGSGTGTGQGAGGTAGTGAGQPAPGTAGTGGTTGAGTAGGAGTPQGSSTDAVPPGLLPVSVPPGTLPLAAAPGQPPANAAQAQGQAQAQQPAAGAPALAGQLLGPFLPGQAPALLLGGTAFALPGSPFAAPGQSAGSTPSTSNAVAPGAANRPASVPASVPASAPAHGPSAATAPQQSRPAADRSPGAQAQSQYATGDWPSEEEDNPWDTTEVMMLLLALILPVLCILAAMFTVRNRGRK
ncbi:hypothetical protein Kpho01_67140 [Kitasatospora phosalacinea]|uniref:Uncharacterized protein n=1 Tax=Kitasatospora phosalacinea TaxID=2065 RepID=A0A9W6PPN9_9ACTN|nr:hypothetical protein Kpho01_67140 [Kitasatospora phosalacinea]